MITFLHINRLKAFNQQKRENFIIYSFKLINQFESIICNISKNK
jgi:hypothetical protein